jgi:hypothetical protein
VIRAEIDTTGVVLVAALPPGSVAYVDQEWLPISSGEVPSLVAAPEGALAWCGGRPVQTSGNVDSDTKATLVLLGVAQAAVAAVEGVSPDSIEVTGSGLIALQVRALLGERSSEDDRSSLFERPRAIIDTTGDPRVIVEATRRIAELGTVVLVGESLGRTAEMNLYPDVHVRGLALVGVPPPLQHAGALFAQTDADDPLVASCREALVGVNAGTPLKPGVAWYRVSG